MWEHILVPVDGSDPATAALEHALDVANDHDATIHALYVADTDQPSLTRIGTDVVDALEREGAEIVADARERAERRGVSVDADVVQGKPRDVIVASANEPLVDLVVMGTSGRNGVTEYVLGSVTEHVVNASETPVLSVRAAEDATRRHPYDRLLVPTDGSEHARAAIELAAAVATHHDASLDLLFVIDDVVETIEPGSAPLPGTRRAEAILEDAERVATQRGVDDVTTALEVGSVARDIRSYAASTAVDLVVMGTHGRSGVTEHLLGSTTERVVRISPVPVLSTTEREP